MKRRESLKAIAVTALSTGVLLQQSCDTEKKESANKPILTSGVDRHPFEKARDEKLMNETFFTDHEMMTIHVLVDIIIPKDGTSGSATDAGVPAFIEFIVKDIPRHQLPMRGGLKWLDVECLKRFNKTFVECNESDRLRVVDDIAYPEKAKPEMKQGVIFFNLIRDLTATGFFTTEMGLKDLGYAGNKPNRWDGVPQDILDQYGLKYDEKTLAECVKWDDEA
jgi:gluconate 2-dehydrogenase gamma chain